MNRTPGRLVEIGGMLALAVPLVAQGPPVKDRPQAFKLTLDAKLELELDKKQQSVQSFQGATKVARRSAAVPPRSGGLLGRLFLDGHQV